MNLRKKMNGTGATNSMAFAQEKDRLAQCHEQFECYECVQAIEPAGVGITTQKNSAHFVLYTHMHAVSCHSADYQAVDRLIPQNGTESGVV